MIDDRLELNRRELLRAGAGVAAGAAALGAPHLGAASANAAEEKILPKRPLGKTGVDVTMLTLGTWRNPGLDRLLRFSYANGVRYVDTAKSYNSEPGIKRWLENAPEARKEIFLVTKDERAREPRELIPLLDERLKSLGVDHVDLFFVHALGDHSVQHGLEWPKSKEMKETVEAIKKSGKARFVGFSSHHARRAEFLQAAAEGGFLDVIMLQYTPWLDKDAPLNRALDACHKKGIGLVSMKQVAGQFAASKELAEVVKQMPDVLKAKKLTPYQGLLHAIWTDERIASVCVSMRNTDQIRLNAEAARSFEPLKTAEILQLRDAALAAGPTLCADCDGRCAAAAGTKARLGDITRYLTYHDHHGYRSEARENFAKLADHERDWSNADLEAARDACPSRLDFARLLPRADRVLG